MIKVNSDVENRIFQGDIFKDVEFIEYALEVDGTFTISKIVFPLVLILTQDCDLKQDDDFRNSNVNNHDKFLISVLVVPIYNIQHFYSGAHLSELGLNMTPYENRPDKMINKKLKQNEIPRYHHLNFSEEIPIVESVIDFKHYFSVNVEYLKKIKNTNFVCRISQLYREDISQRFAYFLSRIGLPD